MERLARVERRRRRRVGVGSQHREGRRGLVDGGVVPRIARPRGEVPDDQRTERVGGTRIGLVDHRAAVLEERHRIARTGAGQPGLVDGAVGLQVVGDGGTGLGRSGHQGRREPQSGDDDPCRGQPQDRTTMHATHEIPPSNRFGVDGIPRHPLLILSPPDVLRRANRGVAPPPRGVPVGNPCHPSHLRLHAARPRRDRRRKRRRRPAIRPACRCNRRASRTPGVRRILFS